MPIQTATGTGGLWFNTNPEGATIVLDDQEYSIQTPTAVNNIPPGPHTFTIKLEGYDDISDTADVIVGRMCCVEYDLTSEVPEPTKSCSPTPLPQAEAPPAPIIPDYKTFVSGMVVGGLLVFIAEKGYKKKE